jgi:2-desacetyl-2-hydroxyethyl bacteriochlorophyllide A dehydrogenase
MDEVTVTQTVIQMASARIPTSLGQSQLRLYTSTLDNKEHLALLVGAVEAQQDVLVRVHSECFTGDVLGSLRCDCGPQLNRALEMIAEEGQGIVVYLRQEGRGIGLLNKLRAYNLQDEGYDTVEANLLLGHQADERDYTVAALILKQLGIHSIRLLTNNPLKTEGLERAGITVSARVPLQSGVNSENAAYLLTKAKRMRHMLSLDASTAESKANGNGCHKRPPMTDSKKRLALFFNAPYDVSVREEAMPKPVAGEVLVRTQASAISAGTERLIYRGQAPNGLSVDETIPALAGQFNFPMKYGYAAVGQVVALGEGVASEWMGKTVFAFQPHASHFISSTTELLTVPAGLSPEEAALLPLMETSVNLLMDGQPLIGERVAIFGQGIVGLLTTALLARFPLAALVTLDKHPLRRQKSLAMGAQASLDPQATEAIPQLAASFENDGTYVGADLTYELSGNPAALDQAIEMTGSNGRVVVGSWYGQNRVSLDLGGRFHRSRIRLISSQVSTISNECKSRWTKLRRLDVAWQMLERLRPAHLITHRFPLHQAAQAYALLDQHPEQAIQILLTRDGQ